MADRGERGLFFGLFSSTGSGGMTRSSSAWPCSGRTAASWRREPYRTIGINITARLAIVLVVTVLATVRGCSLRRVNDAAPVLDAFTTGQPRRPYLMTKKIIENWYVWIFADVLYIYLYIQRGLLLTSVLYVIFLLMCIAGALQWQRSLRSSSSSLPASA
jgi:nicotinamide mononucleotide transporter